MTATGPAAEAPARPTPARPAPTLLTRLMGAGVWALLMATILGSAYLIQYYFAEDVLRHRVTVAVRLEVSEVLIGQGSVPQLEQALRTLETVLQDDPANADAVLLLEQAFLVSPEGAQVRQTLEAALDRQKQELGRRKAGKGLPAMEARFLLARLDRLSSEAAKRAAADADLSALVGELETVMKSSAAGKDAAFLLARVYRSRANPDAAELARMVELLRVAGRREPEMRLNAAGKVPLATSLERAAAALDKGLIEVSRRHLSAVFGDDRENVAARLILAETELAGRQDGDVQLSGDRNIVRLIREVVESGKAPLRAEVYLAAFDAMGSAEDQAKAKERYAKAVAAGFDPVAEGGRLADHHQPGTARLVLAAETLLGPDGTARKALAEYKRAELILEDAHGDAAPESALERLRRAVRTAPKPEDLPPRASAYLAAVETDEAAAAEAYAQAVKRGFDPLKDAAELGAADRHTAARWLLRAAAGRGFGLSRDPVRDSELHYQLGRTFAAGRNSQFQQAVVHYHKAVEAGRAAKAPGAGKAALSIARVYSNLGDPAKLAEAREMVALAKACGIERMDITTADKVLAGIEKAAAELHASPHGDGRRKIAPH